MLTWFESVSQAAITKLVRDKWDITGEVSGTSQTSLGSTETIDLDLWNDFAAPLAPSSEEAIYSTGEVSLYTAVVS